MTAFFADVWHDLRERRLWPVALLLVLALVAVPVLLLKPGADTSDNASAPAAAAASPRGGLQLAELPKDDSAENSDLGVFDPKDPFRPPGGYTPSAGASGGGSAMPVPTPGLSAAGGGSSDTGASTGGGSVASSTGGTVGQGSAAPSGKSRPKKRSVYTYVVDIRFGERGEVRTRKGVSRLTLLPSSRNPLLVFLGVSADRRSAVFLVESDVSQEGEGRCKPSRRYCSFLYLRTADGSDDHYFATENGGQYVLHLSKIRRRKVEPRKKKRSRTSAPRSRSGPSHPGAIFDTPLFADEQR